MIKKPVRAIKSFRNKYLALILITLSFSFNVNAQWQKPNNAYGTISNGERFNRILLFPTGCGTPPALNSADSAQMAYAIYGDSCNDKVYFYNPSTKVWSVISGSTGTDDSAFHTASSPDTNLIKLNANNHQTVIQFVPVGGEGGSGGSYHLPYNGNSTDYLGGDTVYHPLPESITQSQLDDSTAAIRDAIGTIPSLQQVANVGDTATTIVINNSNIYNNTTGLVFIDPINPSSARGAMGFYDSNPWFTDRYGNTIQLNWRKRNGSVVNLSPAIFGTATLSSGTITVSTTLVKAGDKIFVSYNTPSGTQGFLSAPVGSIVDSTSFVINSSSATDNSTVNWVIEN